MTAFTASTGGCAATEERFVVRPCHGQKFTNRPDPVVSYVVLDRFDCYRRIVEIGGQGMPILMARRQAETLTARLNEDELLGEPES